MVPKKLLLSALLLLSIFVNAQKTFEKPFGGTSEDWAQTAVTTDDSGFIFTGITYSWGCGSEDFLMVKLDQFGDTVWEKTFGGPLDDYGYRMHKTHDGGYLITGHTDSYGAGDCDGYVVKTDLDGDTIWTRTYGGDEDDIIHGAIELANGDWLMVGYTENFGAQMADFFFLKTDANGNARWIKTIGGAQKDVGECVGRDRDGNVLLGGRTWTYGAGGQDFYVIKADTDGNVIWKKTYGREYADQFWDMKVTDDGGAVLAGCSFNADSTRSQCYIVKINGEGNIQWESNYGNSVCASARYISKTMDGGYLITGDIKDTCNPPGDVLLLKLDSVGKILWQKTFGGAEDENGNFVTETADSNILVLGRTVSYGAGWSDCYIIKTDNTGTAVPTGISELQNTRSFAIYPNPSYGYLQVASKSPLVPNSYIQIIDGQGKVYLQQKLLNDNTFVDVHMLAAGTYCYEVLNASGKLADGKFVLLK